LNDRKAPDEQEATFEGKLAWMGISVASSVVVGVECLWPEWGKGSRKLGLAIEVSMDGALKTSCTGDGRPIDILLIHATRLWQIKQYLGMDLDELVAKWHGVIPHIVVHSGRGKTSGDIPRKTAFVEYSTVERYVLQEPSKFYLTRVLMDAGGGDEWRTNEDGSS
jgi:hypothetical protein